MVFLWGLGAHDLEMSKITLVCLLAIFAYVAYPNAKLMLCTVLPTYQSCNPPQAKASASVENLKVAQSVTPKHAVSKPVVDASVPETKKVFKWVDDKGITHFGEKKLNDNQVTYNIKQANVIEGVNRAMQVNLKAAGTVSTSRHINTVASNRSVGTKHTKHLSMFEKSAQQRKERNQKREKYLSEIKSLPENPAAARNAQRRAREARAETQRYRRAFGPHPY